MVNHAECSYRRTYLSSQGAVHTSMLFGVPAPCGSLPGPYLSSCTATTRVTSLALLQLSPVSTRHIFLSSSLLLIHIFSSRHAAVSSQQGRERISTGFDDHKQPPVDWRFAPNSLGKLGSVRAVAFVPLTPCRLAPLPRYHPRQQPLLATTRSLPQPSHRLLQSLCATPHSVCIGRPQPLAVKVTPARTLGFRISDAPASSWQVTLMY